jgi:hypothetical protein
VKLKETNIKKRANKLINQDIQWSGNADDLAELNELIGLLVYYKSFGLDNASGKY